MNIQDKVEKTPNYRMLEITVHFGVKFSIFNAEIKKKKKKYVLKEMDLRSSCCGSVD